MFSKKSNTPKMRHTITASSCYVISIRTTRHKTEYLHASSASPSIRSIPHYFVTFTTVHYKRAEYFRALDKITNHTDIRLEQKTLEHNCNVAHNHLLDCHFILIGSKTFITLLCSSIRFAFCSISQTYLKTRNNKH